MPNTIKITNVCVCARNPHLNGDKFEAIFNQVESIFNGAIKEAGMQYQAHRSKFHKVPFYDEHGAEKIYIDEWLLPEHLAKKAIAKATKLVKENDRFFPSASYIQVEALDSEELTLNEVSEVERLAQRYSKSPALFTKAVPR